MVIVGRQKWSQKRKKKKIYGPWHFTRQLGEGDDIWRALMLRRIRSAAKDNPDNEE